MSKLFLVLAIMLALLLGTIAIAKGIDFDVNIGQHLKRAADANILQLAKEELTAALTVIEARQLTAGNTSILIPAPCNDLAFWHKNLKASLGELDRALANPKMSQLEQSNVLIKLRETLLDHGESIHVTAPAYISVHPHQGYLAFGWVIFVVLLILAGVSFWIEEYC